MHDSILSNPTRAEQPSFTSSSDPSYNSCRLGTSLAWIVDSVYPNCLPIKGEALIMPKAVGKPRVKKSLSDLELPPRAKRPEALTSREQEILEFIWAGFKNKEIGQRLRISVKTVEAHRANMMKKMRVSNTAQLLKTCIQGGMLKIR